ncbi:uncharacterized protein LOC132556048 [Ylistrum balloti]|uniref:uncharacterized protein LOC132556048 n=1 Tax=Ylistrum balloti TaxID=509963 RepID=UPI002905B1D1|nr:uncharacterized protein LOC132556048 [Ylistrum balloti]
MDIEAWMIRKLFRMNEGSQDQDCTSQGASFREKNDIIFTYRRVSSRSSATVMLEERPNTVHEVKMAVAKSLGECTDNIDVIDKATILETELSDSVTDDIVEVMIHRESRRVPKEKRTRKEDMFEGDMADGDRIEMSCGHAATPENIYRYCLTKLNSNDLGFKCMECSTIWDFAEIACKADMSEDESVFFTRKMSDVFIAESNDIRECPQCRSFCTRIDTNNKYVACQVCKENGRTSYSFCWECYRPGVHPHNCQHKHTQDVLDNCQRVTMQYSDIRGVPQVRACPKCELFIEHESGCKTMTCTKCHHVFCFSCLKSAVNGHLICGQYDSICTVAPVQKIGAKRNK